MPKRPGRPCAAPGCAAVVNGDVRYCEQHQRKRTAVDVDQRRESASQRKRTPGDVDVDQRRESASQRGYGVRWRRLRLMVLNEHPLCVDPFGTHGSRMVPATDVDHIVPRVRGGTDEFGNLQALCHSCHSRKTRDEMRDVLNLNLRRAAVPTTVVAGPPGSGKTTLVKSRAQWGDLIVDLDAIFSAISGLDWYDSPGALFPFAFACRDALLRQLAEPSGVRHAWIITSEGDSSALNRMCDQLGATLQVMDVDADECIRRIGLDERRKEDLDQWEEIVRRWHRKYAGLGG